MLDKKLIDVDVLPKICALLKKNTVHHLSLKLYPLLAYLFRVLKAKCVSYK